MQPEALVFFILVIPIVTHAKSFSTFLPFEDLKDRTRVGSLDMHDFNKFGEINDSKSSIKYKERNDESKEKKIKDAEKKKENDFEQSTEDDDSNEDSKEDIPTRKMSVKTKRVPTNLLRYHSSVLNHKKTNHNGGFRKKYQTVYYYNPNKVYYDVSDDEIYYEQLSHPFYVYNPYHALRRYVWQHYKPVETIEMENNFDSRTRTLIPQSKFSQKKLKNEIAIGGMGLGVGMGSVTTHSSGAGVGVGMGGSYETDGGNRVVTSYGFSGSGIGVGGGVMGDYIGGIGDIDESFGIDVNDIIMGNQYYTGMINDGLDNETRELLNLGSYLRRLEQKYYPITYMENYAYLPYSKSMDYVYY